MTEQEALELAINKLMKDSSPVSFRDSVIEWGGYHEGTKDFVHNRLKPAFKHERQAADILRALADERAALRTPLMLSVIADGIVRRQEYVDWATKQDPPTNPDDPAPWDRDDKEIARIQDEINQLHRARRLLADAQEEKR